MDQRTSATPAAVGTKAWTASSVSTNAAGFPAPPGHEGTSVTAGHSAVAVAPSSRKGPAGTTFRRGSTRRS